MLQTQAVDDSTLELIKKLQKKEYLKNFYLAGGTALAISLGHRKSIDIDLFSDFSFDIQYLIDSLNHDFDFNLFSSAPNTLKGSISNIKIDIIAHRYKLINVPILYSDILLLSIEDIIAMKLNAITVNGQRIKDFIDIFFLLDKYNIDEMLKYYQIKYNSQNPANVLKSLTWFNDVDTSEWPMILYNKNLTWSKVKIGIKQKVLEYTFSK